VTDTDHDIVETESDAAQFWSARSLLGGRAIGLALMLAIAMPGIAMVVPETGFITPAMADDDDGDDDDGDDDGDDGDDGDEGDEGDDGDEGGGEGDDDDAGASSGGSGTSAGDQGGDDDDDSEDIGNVLGANLTGNEIHAARSLGFTILRQRTLSNLSLVLTTLATPQTVDADSAIATLNTRTRGNRFAAHPVYTLANRPTRGEQRDFARQLIGWPANADRCGAGTRIGILDTAVDNRASALRRSAIVLRNGDRGTSKADRRHGTAVAALIVGQKRAGFSGTVPAAKLYSAAVFRDGKSGKTKLENILVGLDWLLAQRAQVINFSLTGPDHPLLKQAIRRTQSRGVHIVAAAGNQGPFGPVAYPAAYRNVIAVTAVDRNRRPYAHANRGSYITLAAPGVGLSVPGASGGTRTLSGTSFSAAIVTGMVAEILRTKPEMSIAGVRSVLRRGAQDLGRAGRDQVFGWGLAQHSPACAHPGSGAIQAAQ